MWSLHWRFSLCFEMEVCVFSSLLTVLCVGLFGRYTYAADCSDYQLVATPSSLLVEYGNPAEVNCSISNRNMALTNYKLSVEAKSLRPTTSNESVLMWKVDSLTNWEEDKIFCSLAVSDTSCMAPVNISIYKTPDRVTLSSVPDVMVERNQAQLCCQIENVGPGYKLSVHWSRADPKQNNFTQFNETLFPDLENEKKIVNKTAYLTIIPSREDDGAKYLCEAVLNLDQIQIKSKSQPITISVQYTDHTYLTIIPSREDDGAKYLCEAVLNLDQIQMKSKSQPITISVQYTDHNCLDYQLVATPSSLLVEYGNPAEVNCSISNRNKTLTNYLLGVEGISLQRFTSNESVVMWKVDSLTNWEEDKVLCYLAVSETTCNTTVNINIYKTPDSVTLSSVPDVMVERNQAQLCCQIENVGPGYKLSVHWSRADPKQNNFIQFNETLFPDLENEKKIVNKTAYLTIIPSREDDGAKYLCEAVLNLDQIQMKSKSQPITISVQYTDHNCSDYDLVATPSSLLVEYGNPAEVNCSISNRNTALTKYLLSLEAKSLTPTTSNESVVMWKVDSLTNWEEDKILCSLGVSNTSCMATVNISIYKTPDSVTLSSVPDVMVERNQTQLWCQIENVGPGYKLSVHWSRADPKQNNFIQFNETLFPDLENEKKIVNKTAYLTIIPSREDDGAKYLCEAVLNLDQIQMKNKSQPITISVQYTDHNCSDYQLVATPSSLLVEYGNPAEVNCSISNRNKTLTNYQLGVETKSLRLFTWNERVVMWKVDSLTNWEEDQIFCSLTVSDTSCMDFVNINIYKTPDSVTLSSVPDVMVERNQTQLCCQIENVGPGYKLSVHWSRADPKQNNFTQFNETLFPDLEDEKKSVNKTAYLTIIPSREDDGAKYLCEAVLNLDQIQMKSKSQPITISVQYTDHNCSDYQLVATPSSLLVEYGNPAEVNCSISKRNKTLTNYLLGVEGISLQRFTINENFVMWKVDSLTNWEEDQIMCYLLSKTSCNATVNISIYKTPDRVTLSSVPDVMVERNQTQLCCQIENVGPGYKLSVHWSRADPKQNNFIKFHETLFPDLKNEKKSVNITAYLTIIPSREDDGAKYLCEAVLNLDQIQIKSKSQPITISVQYTDHNCSDYQLVATPSSLLVEYGNPAEVNCSISNRNTALTNYLLGVESISLQRFTRNESVVMCKVDSLTNWEEDQIMCYLLSKTSCNATVNISIYKTPDSVTLSSVPDVMVERNQAQLCCQIENVGPGYKLSVHWSRADPKQNNFIKFHETLFPDLENEKKSVNKTAYLTIIPSREDDGAKYLCEAVLNLDQKQMKSKSQPITISVQYTDHNCLDYQLVATPSSLLVEYGNPAEVNCSISNRNMALTNYLLGVEAKSLWLFTWNESVVMWKVDSLTNWEEDKILCYLALSDTQCTTTVNINIYKTPDSVTLSSVPDVMVERNQAQLWCQIENVGPGYKLSVHWSRADPKQNNFIQFHETLFPDLENEKKSVNKTAYLTIIPSREDDGAKYLCEAVLNLDQIQMKSKSQPITISVQYTDHKTPDRVTLSSVPDVMVERNQAQLCCQIENVGPGYKLSVHWSRADPKQNNFIKFHETLFPDLENEKKSVNKTAYLTIIPSREDDGAKYLCEAVLNLDQIQMKSKSQPITISVQYTDHTYLTIIPSREDDGAKYLCEAVLNLDQIQMKSKSQPITISVQYTDHSCSDYQLVVTPSSLLVEYGNPAEVNCSISNRNTALTNYQLGVEAKSLQRFTRNESVVMWKMDSLTNWEEDKILCSLTVNGTQCTAFVNINIYKTPDSVTLSSVPDVMVERNQTQLWCQIENVGPGYKLSVHWSRADPKQNNFIQFHETLFPDLENEKKIVNKTAYLTIIPSREDDGAKYLCEAVLNLDQIQMKNKSQPITISVQYTDHTGIITLIIVLVSIMVLGALAYSMWRMYYHRTQMGQYIMSAEDHGELLQIEIQRNHPINSRNPLWEVRKIS
ncbi:uncharacterized protein LOC113637223 isoform X3 [Tachysurus fulvidraco]|uniref:uncharacterized protein LOC113637223 isoform X3 n=1 Tax=Tachysurus fulvidraco TaxID=1234273 RepID=UPI001FEDEFF4|nr:uncharacterized protein LOC113637223 isoform X3 [Tachysurus fulvidraco]